MSNFTVSNRLDAWAARYERTATEAPDYELDILRAHPDPHQRACIVVVFPVNMEVAFSNPGVPRPSYVIRHKGQCQAVWWIDLPVTDTAVTPKAWNTWKQVSQCLAYNLEGQVIDTLANADNLDFEAQLPAVQKGFSLAGLKEALIKHGLMTKASTMPPGMAGRGGLANTDKQAEARRANLAKGRAKKAAKREAERLALLPKDDELVDIEDLVEMLSVSAPPPVSAQRTMARARRRV